MRCSPRVMNMTPARTYPHCRQQGTRCMSIADGRGRPAAELHVAVEPDLPPAQQGAGGVHHVAFRTPDAEYDAWADRLAAIAHSQQRPGRPLLFPQPLFPRAERHPVRDRHRRPGLRADEPLEHRSARGLALPPFLEAAPQGDRSGTEAALGPRILHGRPPSRPSRLDGSPGQADDHRGQFWAHVTLPNYWHFCPREFTERYRNIARANRLWKRLGGP